ncbi:MAG: hypothetical protein RLZ98_2301 [Pseudomonadota bacterium]
MSTREPIFNAPSVVVILMGMFIAIHIGGQIISVADEEWLLLALALIPERYTDFGPQIPGHPWAEFTSPITHMFLHGDFVHLAMNTAWFLAVGTVAARRLGSARLIIAFIASGLAGAALFIAANPGERVVMIGASGAISGLMAIVLRLLFSAKSPELRWLLTADPRLVPRSGLLELLQDRRAMIVIGIWIALNLVFAFGWSNVLVDGKIAWEAHLGGFFCGLLLFGAIDPGPGRKDEERLAMDA